MSNPAANPTRSVVPHAARSRAPFRSGVEGHECSLVIPDVLRPNIADSFQEMSGGASLAYQRGTKDSATVAVIGTSQSARAEQFL